MARATLVRRPTHDHVSQAVRRVVKRLGPGLGALVLGVSLLWPALATAQSTPAVLHAAGSRVLDCVHPTRTQSGVAGVALPAASERTPSARGTVPAAIARDAPATTESNPANVGWAQWTLFVVQVAGLIALIVYVWKTWEMATATTRAATATTQTVEEMRAARENASAPRVVVYFASQRPPFAEVVLENFGDGTATDVLCTFDPPLRTARGREAGEFFKTPKTLPPRARLAHAFDSWVEVFGNDTAPKQYVVTVTYRGLGAERTYREVRTHSTLVRSNIRPTSSCSAPRLVRHRLP